MEFELFDESDVTVQVIYVNRDRILADVVACVANGNGSIRAIRRCMLAKGYDISEKYLSKVLRELMRRGIVANRVVDGIRRWVLAGSLEHGVPGDGGSVEDGVVQRGVQEQLAGAWCCGGGDNPSVSRAD